jgi:uncharacterized protein (TIGR02217 family)
MPFDRFRDVYLPEQIGGYGWVSAPRWKTTIQVSHGGNETPNQEWEHPLHRFVNPEIISRPDQQSLIDLKSHWLVMSGPYYFFPLSDPLDKASIDHLPNLPDDDLEALISETDQHIAFGDGFTDSFQLKKTYSRSGFTYTRLIQFPVVSTVAVAVAGVLADPSTYDVTRQGGVITFDTPPADDAAITAGFLFDVPVRFESDDQLEQIVRTWQAAGAADLTLIEVRPC